MNIYVGNMPFSMSEENLRAAFEAHGEVSSANVIMDRQTGRPRGFAFVEMPNDEEAQAAIETLNGQDFDGRELRVNEAHSKGGGGGGGGGGGRGGPRR